MVLSGTSHAIKRRYEDYTPLTPRCVDFTDITCPIRQSSLTLKTRLSKMNKLFNIEQLLGICMMIIMTVLLWGDWVVLTLLYIPFVGVLALVNILTWLQTHRAKDTTE